MCNEIELEMNLKLRLLKRKIGWRKQKHFRYIYMILKNVIYSLVELFYKQIKMACLIFFGFSQKEMNNLKNKKVCLTATFLFQTLHRVTGQDFLTIYPEKSTLYE